MAAIHPKWRTPAFSLNRTRALGGGAHHERTLRPALYLVIFGMVLSYTTDRDRPVYLALERPDVPRPYRCTGYPWAAGIYVLVGVAWTLNTIIQRPTEAFWGAAIVLIGVPGYLYWKRKGRAKLPAEIHLAHPALLCNSRRSPFAR